MPFLQFILSNINHYARTHYKASRTGPYTSFLSRVRGVLLTSTTNATSTTKHSFQSAHVISSSSKKHTKNNNKKICLYMKHLNVLRCNAMSRPFSRHFDKWGSEGEGAMLSAVQFYTSFIYRAPTLLCLAPL